MNTPNEFDDIRPFNSEELPAVYERLLANPQFQAVLRFLYPNIPLETIATRMRKCKTNMEFQLTFCYGFLKDLLKHASRGCDMDISGISNRRCYTFMSNHRDIVLDSALLDMLLVDAKFDTTCEIAIGDNLLSLPWVLDIVRVNKSFIVRRGLMAKDRLKSSIELSRYMHFAIQEKHENLWIAQPLSISYEFDPCDYLKAAEFQLRRDNPDWHKGPMDDVISMRTGIAGFKGHIHFHCAPCIDDYLEALKSSKNNNNEVMDEICNYIDHQIHLYYRLYPGNYIALDELRGTKDFTDQYSEHQKEVFDAYLHRRLSKIDIPNKDDAFLRERLLTMYANPAINYRKAHGLE